jgi:hypothetical protein
MQQPFEHPEIVKLFGVLLTNIVRESGRRALLIATAHVDEHLTDLIEVVLPYDYSKKQKDKLFNYPGPLSSLAAKIEIAYAFRLINRDLYSNLSSGQNAITR